MNSMNRKYYYRYIITDRTGAEISRDYITRKDAEFDLPEYAKYFGGCKIKKRRYYFV